MSSERERMLDGLLYDASDAELVAMRRHARNVLREYNATPADTDEDDARRREMLKKFFGSTGNSFKIEPPFFCDYGCNIYVGEAFYMNFDCVILDCARVDIGRDVMCGPKVQIYTARHPVIAAERIKGPELASPIKIGDNVWLGGGCIICPGVTIGDNSTVAAGAVVTKDVPANVVVGGNPATIIKELPPPADS
eukprot:TRINITY_DN26685_c0_g1_i1.p2 TRINITY_DN26685_c0_g1~~TRINITY_DN26685_c0_g1_i1.p2  ORF type:complete len:225 (+),score=45.91 TRINITY_DN26685_c0_g1_i1:96-677(+)